MCLGESGLSLGAIVATHFDTPFCLSVSTQCKHGSEPGQGGQDITEELKYDHRLALPRVAHFSHRFVLCNVGPLLQPVF